jgi:hypothetical protein
MAPDSNYNATWYIRTFASASLADKQEVAEKWFEHFIEVMNQGDAHPVRRMYESVESDMDGIRQMLWAIPATSRVFSNPQDGYSKWILEHFNTRIPVQDDLRFDNMPLVRDVWLQPVAADRRSALLKMLDINGDYGRVSGGSPAAKVAALAAWDVAAENDMDTVAVAAATQITLWTYMEVKYTAVNTRQPILNALRILLARCDIRDVFSQQRSSRELKEEIAKYPAASAYLLQFIEQHPKYKNWVMHEEATDYSLGKVRPSLTALLPAYEGLIALGEQLGLSYREVLASIIATFTVLPEAELPQEMGAE